MCYREGKFIGPVNEHEKFFCENTYAFRNYERTHLQIYCKIIVHGRQFPVAYFLGFTENKNYPLKILMNIHK